MSLLFAARSPGTVATQGPEAPIFSPDEVISAVLGQNAIQLAGFTAVNSLSLPVRLPMVDIPNDPRARLHVGKARKRLQQRIHLFLGTVAMGLALFSFGLGTLATSTYRSVPVRTPQWHVSGISDHSLIVEIGDSKVKIPLGAPLPNGEEILSVDAERQVYVTAYQTVSLRDPKKVSR
ncbi:MAG: hypothetical protein V4731_04880 [Pseudomonadota bacterium]